MQSFELKGKTSTKMSENLFLYTMYAREPALSNFLSRSSKLLIHVQIHQRGPVAAAAAL